MTEPTQKSGGSRRWAITGAVGLVCAVVLALFALRLLNARCERFACVAVGIAWILWAAFYVPVLTLLHLARARVARGGGMARALRIGIILLWGGALALFVQFLVRRLA